MPQQLGQVNFQRCGFNSKVIHSGIDNPVIIIHENSPYPKSTLAYIQLVIRHFRLIRSLHKIIIYKTFKRAVIFNSFL